MQTATDPTVLELSDRAAIGNLIMLYASGIDRRDFGMVGECFTPEVQDAGVAEAMRGIVGSAAARRSVHFILNQTIDTTGDSGDMETYALSLVPFDRGGGKGIIRVRGTRYLSNVVRYQGEWQMRKLISKVDWEREEDSALVYDLPTEEQKAGLVKFSRLRNLTAQDLADRAAISDVLIRYTRGLALRSREIFGSCFTEDLYAFFFNQPFLGRETLVSRFIPPGTVPVSLSPPQKEARAGGLLMGNQLIELHGDTADVESYVLSFNGRLDGDDAGLLVRDVRYIDKAVRQGAQWRLSSRFHEAELARRSQEFSIG